MKYLVTMKDDHYNELNFATTSGQEIFDIINMGLKNGYTLLVSRVPDEPTENKEGEA